jgi:hypothetical protein
VAIDTSHAHPLSLATAPATGLWLRRRRRRLPGRLLVAPASKVRPDLICTLHRRRQLPHRLRDSQLHSLCAQQPRPLAVAGGRAAGTRSWAAARVSSPSSPTQPAHQQQSSPQHGAAAARSGACARVRVCACGVAPFRVASLLPPRLLLPLSRIAHRLPTARPSRAANHASFGEHAPTCDSTIDRRSSLLCGGSLHLALWPPPPPLAPSTSY